jgi:sec-independent protein translocase protein TatA
MISPTALLLAIMGMGPTELIVILVILLILFGGTKLPGLAKGLGQSIKEFKKSSKDDPEPEVVTKPTEVKKSDTPAQPTTH